MRLKKALMIKAGGGIRGEFATTAILTKQLCSVTTAIAAMNANLIACEKVKNELATNTETPPATAVFGKRHAARLPGDTGAGAAEAAENQEAERKVKCIRNIRESET